MYLYGIGVPENFEEALNWYRLAAAQGHAAAASNLGAMYKSGRGVATDLVYAYMWSSISVTNGNDIAAENVDLVASQMTPEQIEAAQALADSCISSGYVDC